MHPILGRTRRFQDLMALADHGLPYHFQTIFSDEGWRARRRSKKKLKLLKKIDDTLRAELQEGEEVRFLTEGLSAAFVESFFLGWLLYVFNRRAIVFTDRRIYLLQIDWRRRPAVLRSQIRYPAIERSKRSFFGATKLKLKNGRTAVFSGIRRLDRKVVRGLVDFLQNQEYEDASATGQEELCPHCRETAVIGMRRCPSCGGVFKSPKRAGFLSLLFPGIGDFYMGHRKMAALELTGVSLIWLGSFIPDPSFPMTPLLAVITALTVIAFIHVPDAVGTWYLARRGIYPG